MAFQVVARSFLCHLLSEEDLILFPVVTTRVKILLHTGKRRIYHQVKAPLRESGGRKPALEIYGFG